jgi:hypothetical protein
MAKNTGRILHDEGNARFVEVSQTFDNWSAVPVQQTVARFQYSYYEQERIVTLQRPDPDANEQIKTFPLSFEEMDTLMAAYQAFLADREAVNRRSDDFYQLYSSLDDHPF